MGLTSAPGCSPASPGSISKGVTKESSGRSDAGRLAGQIAQIIEPRAAHASAAKHLNFFEPRRMQRKDALDADSVRDLAHGKRGAIPAAVHLDDNTLEGLATSLFALDRLDLQSHRVADAKLRNILAQFALFELTDDCIHSSRTSE